MSANDSESKDYTDDITSSESERSDVTRAKSGWGMAGGNEAYQFPKTDFRHWEKKLFRHSYMDGGSRVLSKSYSVRMAWRGKRHNFPLGLSNQRAAAKKARDIHLMLISQGWDATLAQFKPTHTLAAVEEGPATVGSYIAAAETVSSVRARTFNGYCVALRRIVAGMKALDNDPRKHGPKKGGAAKWREAVEKTPLAELTPEAVHAWKLAYLAKAGNDPAAQRRAKNTFNSTMRQARSLFGRKILSLLADRLSIPNPLPLAGVALWERGSTRYMSKMDPQNVITSAAAELSANPETAEVWKIFLLALCCGLRKNEIDSLTWKQIDFRTGTIRIQETPFFQPKAQESVGEVDMDEEVAAVLKESQKHTSGEFVIESALQPQGPGKQARYRAAPHFEALNDWLRQKGVTARKPLHELRKEAGSLVALHKGLFAAQSFLRHASPQTTAAFYLSKKERLSTGLGSLLRAEPQVAAPDQRSDEPATR